MSKSWPDFSLLVPHKSKLPEIGKDFTVVSGLTEQRYAIKVKKIQSLRWNDNGDLVVEIDGDRRILEKGAAE
jgi:hypothetical protein